MMWAIHFEELKIFKTYESTLRCRNFQKITTECSALNLMFFEKTLKKEVLHSRVNLAKKTAFKNIKHQVFL